MNTRKLESMIRDAIEDAIWNYEFETKKKVDNIDIRVNGIIESDDTYIDVCIDEF